MILCLPRLQILGVIRLGDLSSLMGPKKDINVQFVHIFFFLIVRIRMTTSKNYILELKSDLTLFCKSSVLLF